MGVDRAGCGFNRVCVWAGGQGGCWGSVLEYKLSLQTVVVSRCF